MRPVQNVNQTQKSPQQIAAEIERQQIHSDLPLLREKAEWYELMARIKKAEFDLVPPWGRLLLGIEKHRSYMRDLRRRKKIFRQQRKFALGKGGGNE